MYTLYRHLVVEAPLRAVGHPSDHRAREAWLEGSLSVQKGECRVIALAPAVAIL